VPGVQQRIDEIAADEPRPAEDSRSHTRHIKLVLPASGPSAIIDAMSSNPAALEYTIATA
jgi:hypothetical protein